jgi:hypothetical protein
MGLFMNNIGNIDRYNVVWNSPSRDSAGSMPLGNGDIGVNVWAQEDGNLFFYLSKTDAWDENGRLLKLGRIRIEFKPIFFLQGLPFRQTLNLSDGCIDVVAGNPSQTIRIRLWVDANRPVVCVDMEGDEPFEADVHLELWRTSQRTLPEKEDSCPIGKRSVSDVTQIDPDTVWKTSEQPLIWFHRNQRSIWPETMIHQGLESLMAKQVDPILHRTFGAAIVGEGFIKQNDLQLKAIEPKRHFSIRVYPLTSQTDTEEQWVRQLTNSISAYDTVPTDLAWNSHQEWWRNFWQRSYIHIDGCSDALRVAQGYALQRFINACGGRGQYPIKFNGSIFTMDAREKDECFDADYRRWGGGYWFQNTRLPYWSMIMSGDFDLMEPLFKMYRDAMPLAEERTKVYFGHSGAFFPETMSFWGAYLNENYGFDREGKNVGEIQNRYIGRYWQCILELLTIMLDVYQFTQNQKLLTSYLRPMARSFLRFYREHYPLRDEVGKVLMKPAQVLETWHEAVNPLPDIAGLEWVLQHLLELRSELIDESDRNEWRKFREELPPLPTRTYVWEKKTELIPALQYDVNSNSENVTLYAVFPYRLFGLGKENLQTGIDAYHKRPYPYTGGWRQDAIQAALLGLTEDAQKFVVQNFSTPHTGSRFPAFWGPNFDWIPDQDHGTVAMTALQRMVMQCEDDKILLLPAWPKEWNVEFRLHAPGQTVVEGIYRNGKLGSLTVTSEHRRKDIVCNV